VRVLVVKLVFRHDVVPGKLEAYLEWSKRSIKMFEALPFIKSYDVYQSIAGARLITKEIILGDISDLPKLIETLGRPDFAKEVSEFRTYVDNLEVSLIVELL
jgi:hypothetical protein